MKEEEERVEGKEELKESIENMMSKGEWKENKRRIEISE